MLVAPFAPHLAEELWHRLGHETSLFERAVGPDGERIALWPTFDPAKATADQVEFVIQVNGKVRARVTVPRGIGEDQARALAMEDENVRRFVDGKAIRKAIFVPDRLLNLVVA